VPCKKTFPHLVEMQRKYGGQGLVCVSVTIDEPKHKEAALAFLQKVGANFPNYLLDEKVDVWQERLKVTIPPSAFVFDRSGRRVVRLDNSEPDKEYGPEAVEKVEKLVKELLAKP
jgi:thiol-disulfide isomerase/thioredoxin